LSQGKPSPSPLPLPPPPPRVARSFDDRADHGLKIILIGDSGVGKSQIVSQYVEQKFKDNLAATVGVVYGAKTIDVHNYKAKLQICDTSGIERYRVQITQYFRGVVGALAVYDITDSNSFGSIRNWLVLLRNLVDPDVAIILVGNKSDHEGQRMVSFEEGQRFAEREHLLFSETSAKVATNISQAFELLVAEVIARYEKRAFD
jgi:small GTP-binding protein